MKLSCINFCPYHSLDHPAPERGQRPQRTAGPSPAKPCGPCKTDSTQSQNCRVASVRVVKSFNCSVRVQRVRGSEGGGKNHQKG